jgi:hypothetical protein
MGAQFTAGFMLLANGNVRLRVYEGPTANGQPNAFDYQWEILAADWVTILTAVGADGAHAGTADVEDFTANYGKQAGQVGVLEAAS